MINKFIHLNIIYMKNLLYFISFMVVLVSLSVMAYADDKSSQISDSSDGIGKETSEVYYQTMRWCKGAIRLTCTTEEVAYRCRQYVCKY